MEAKPNEVTTTKPRYEYETRMFRDLNEPLTFHYDWNISSSPSHNPRRLSLKHRVEFLR